MNIKRNILLNPGPSTTTDTVKMAQVVPDICPREEEFAEMMRQMRKDLVRIVHGDPQKYTSVLFCGSGTLNLDVCVNSLLPEGKKILVVNNGAYSSRAVEICEYYGLDHINLQFPIDEQPDLKVVEKTMKENPDIGYLKVQASRARQALPVEGVQILVVQSFLYHRVLFFEGKTNADGLIESIPLPAPPVAESLDPKNPQGGAVYQLYASHPSFEMQKYDVEIFADTTAIQPLYLQLKGGL